MQRRGLTARHVFVLDDDAYDAVVALLDWPAEPSPRLADLLTRPSVFST
ncbi:hypothetical protein DVS28_b0394 (plasmid) [Euzebya pacifica]|uniref:DUF1778 domain-containing protein n=1 Tax=Euzebya pacifica TaxID=1608957 RepID=A0A346Y6R2_9ACTN|nr:DUF1778 domain-containing protein [Euzebya pacifica]AXV10159.1 hypothetical protein DVS28_b0394 [Euzebya pacifica]